MGKSCLIKLRYESSYSADDDNIRTDQKCVYE